MHVGFQGGTVIPPRLQQFGPWGKAEVPETPHVPHIPPPDRRGESH
jgi:hypothetical protein